jgi:hypothetical protein
MALAGRSRRGSGRRWVVVALVLTLLVLLVDASIKSRSQSPVREISGQAWMDRVVTLVTESNVVAKDLTSLRTDSSTTGSAALRSDLTTMDNQSEAVYKAFLKLNPPTDLAGPSGLLETCFYLRQKATTTLVDAVTDQLQAPSGSSAVVAAQQMQSAVSELEVADNAYTLFAKRLPASIGRATASMWVPEPSLYTQDKLEVWLTALHNRISLTPVHAIEIVALSTSPSPLGTSGGVETLPAGPLSVQVVVGNTGNQLATDLRVAATVSASSGQAAASDVVDQLTAGGDTTLHLGPLGPRVGVTVTLTVTVTPPTGSGTTAVTKTLQFVMPSSTSSTTTTTSTTSTTTVPGATTTTAPGSSTTTLTTLPGG